MLLFYFHYIAVLFQMIIKNTDKKPLNSRNEGSIISVVGKSTMEIMEPF